MKKSRFKQLLGVFLALVMCLSPLALTAGALELVASISSLDLVLDTEAFPPPVAGEAVARDTDILAALGDGQNFTVNIEYSAWVGQGDNLVIHGFTDVAAFTDGEYALGLGLVPNEGYGFISTGTYTLNGVTADFVNVLSNGMLELLFCNYGNESSVETGVITGFDLTLNPADFAAPEVGGTTLRDPEPLYAMTYGMDFSVFEDPYSVAWLPQSDGEVVYLNEDLTFPSADYDIGIVFLPETGYVFDEIYADNYKINGVSPISVSIEGTDMAVIYDIAEVLAAYDRGTVIEEGVVKGFNVSLDETAFPKASVGEAVTRDSEMFEAAFTDIGLTVSSYGWTTAELLSEYGYYGFFNENHKFVAGNTYYIMTVVDFSEGMSFAEEYIASYKLNGASAVYIEVYEDSVAIGWVYDEFSAPLEPGFNIELDENDFPRATPGGSTVRNETVLAAALDAQGFEYKTCAWVTAGLLQTGGAYPEDTFGSDEYYLLMTFIVPNGVMLTENELESYRLNGASAVYFDANPNNANHYALAWPYTAAIADADGVISEINLYLDEADFPKAVYGGLATRDTAFLTAMVENLPISVDLDRSIWVSIEGGESFHAFDSTDVFDASVIALGLTLVPDEGYSISDTVIVRLNGVLADYANVVEGGSVAARFDSYGYETEGGGDGEDEETAITGFDLTLSPEDVPRPVVGESITVTYEAFDVLDTDMFYIDDGYCGWIVDIDGTETELIFSDHAIFEEGYELLYLSLDVVAQRGYYLDTSDLSGFLLNGIAPVGYSAYAEGYDIWLYYPAEAFLASDIESTLLTVDDFNVKITEEMMPLPVMGELVTVDNAALEALFEGMHFYIGSNYTGWYINDYYTNGETMNVDPAEALIVLDFYADSGYRFDTDNLDKYKVNGVSPIAYYNYGDGNVELYYDPDEVFAGRGDIDENGSINSADYTLLKRAVLGTYTLENETAGDIDENGIINSADYTLLKRAVLGTYTIG